MNPNVRRLIVFVIVFLVIILGFVWFIRRITSRPQQEPVAARTVMTDYADTDTATRFMIKGRIIAEENYREIRITVDRDSRLFEVIDGYRGDVLSSERFNNNEQAYHVFLAALEDAGYTEARRVDANIIPEGTCPTGRRFWYQIVEGGEATQSLWSTTCVNSRGSFGGNADTVRWLFTNQIPDYSKRTRSVQL